MTGEDPQQGWRQLAPSGDSVGPVDAARLAEVSQSLRRGAQRLRGYSTEEIAQTISTLSTLWLAEDSEWMARAVEELPATSGYHPRMVRWFLRDFFLKLTGEGMAYLVDAELGSRNAVASIRAHGALPCASAAIPPRLTFQVLAGTVPPVTVEAIVLSLLVRAPALVKTSRDEPAFGRLYLESLRQHAPELAEHVAVLTWPGGDEALDEAACADADVVCVYGSDESVRAMQGRARYPTRFMGYGHRVSFGVISGGDQTTRPMNLSKVARGYAHDTAAFDQRGCMSPHCVFVAQDAPWSPEEVAKAIAEEGFPAVAEELPQGRMPEGDASRLMQELGVAEFERTVLGEPGGRVILHGETAFHPSPGGRTLHVVPYGRPTDLLAALDPLDGAISTVGLSACVSNQKDLMLALAERGARRITRPGRMQRPLWLRHHDGRPRLGDWVEWMDVEPMP